MSEENLITLVFQGKTKKVKKFSDYEECKAEFQKLFEIDDDEMENISLFYIDEENDKTVMNSSEDYNMFLEAGCTQIEGQINTTVVQKPDPMRSATVFKIKRDESYNCDTSKNLVDSNLDNSLTSLENPENIGIYLGKKSINEGSDKFNEINKLLENTANEKKNEKMIEELQKQMAELKLKHEEEMRKKEEENQKKYNDALAKKESEIKKKVEEEKEKQLNEYKKKTENELKEKYENEMKSNLLLKEKEFDELKSKIELDNQKKMEEIRKKEEENEKKLEELKKKKKKISKR